MAAHVNLAWLRRWALVLCASLLTIWPPIAAAGPHAAGKTGADAGRRAGAATPAEATVTAAQRRTLVSALGTTLRTHYIHQSRIDAILRPLRRRAGRYPDTDDPQALADRLTGDLVALSNDLHFAVIHDPHWVSAQRAAADADQDAGLREDSLAALQASNYGFQHLQRLEGNVGYVRFDAFPDPALAFAVGAAAMQFVQHANALIFDMRYSRGGHNRFAQFLASYLFPAEDNQLLQEYELRRDGETIRGAYRTQPALPGPRLVDVPVYVLTSSMTFSAGEWFAYVLQALGRATVVGERTAGAAHGVERHAIDDRFVLQVPTARLWDPIHKADFEGVGVAPDVETASPRALARAHELAIAELARRSLLSPAELDWLQPLLQSRLQPAMPSAAQLRRFVGRYDGRRIEIENDQLVYRWRERSSLYLQPIGSNLFAAEGAGDTRFRFVQTGDQVTALQRLQRNGAVFSYPRL